MAVCWNTRCWYANEVQVSPLIFGSESFPQVLNETDIVFRIALKMVSTQSTGSLKQSIEYVDVCARASWSTLLMMHKNNAWDQQACDATILK